MATVTEKDHFVWAPDGQLTCDGHDVAELAKSYPTPFYLVSVAQLRDNYRRFRRAFSSVDGVRAYYSVKSNFESIVLRTLVDEGCGAEISGALDLELCRRAGMPGERIVFDGPCKNPADLEEALRADIHLVDLESMTEARTVNEIAGRLGKQINVGIRIDPELPRPYYDKLISTYKQKFGFPISQALEAAVQINAMPNLTVTCLMAHIGSQVFTPSRYLATLDRFFDLAGELRKRSIEIDEFNLGGGYPAQSMKNMRLSRRIVLARVLEWMGRLEADVKSIDEFGSAICGRYKELCARTGLQPRLSLEPGRCLVSNAAAMVGRVLIVKNHWIFTDISINDIPENLFFSEWRMALPGRKPDTKGEPYYIAGPTLATQDVLYFQKPVANPTEGMPMTILDIGAYSIARSNQFTRPRSAVYAIDDDGKVVLVRRAEGVPDVLQSQVWDYDVAAPVQRKAG